MTPRKVNIAGHEFTVVDHDEAELCDVVVCMRVRDMPIPEHVAEMQHCAICSERIWVATTSPKKPPRWCMACATDKLKEREQ